MRSSNHRYSLGQSPPFFLRGRTILSGAFIGANSFPRFQRPTSILQQQKISPQHLLKRPCPTVSENAAKKQCFPKQSTPSMQQHSVEPGHHTSARSEISETSQSAHPLPREDNYVEIVTSGAQKTTSVVVVSPLEPIVTDPSNTQNARNKPQSSPGNSVDVSQGESSQAFHPGTTFQEIVDLLSQKVEILEAVVRDLQSQIRQISEIQVGHQTLKVSLQNLLEESTEATNKNLQMLKSELLQHLDNRISDFKHTVEIKPDSVPPPIFATMEYLPSYQQHPPPPSDLQPQYTAHQSQCITSYSHETHPVHQPQYTTQYDQSSRSSPGQILQQPVDRFPSSSSQLLYSGIAPTTDQQRISQFHTSQPVLQNQAVCAESYNPQLYYQQHNQLPQHHENYGQSSLTEQYTAQNSYAQNTEFLQNPTPHFGNLTSNLAVANTYVGFEQGNDSAAVPSSYIYQGNNYQKFIQGT